MVQYTTTINASLEKVWEHLLFKIEQPENFVPGVSDVIILDKKDNFVIRKMTITTEEHATTLIEKITLEHIEAIDSLSINNMNLKIRIEIFFSYRVQRI